ncbi:MAG: hypothetical protein HRT47_11455 [Candidatus Caenarcaniphilales bacterium]|nr:hypothetical protein [Candidatus Caenarcaniphilales bacterium]
MQIPGLDIAKRQAKNVATEALFPAGLQTTVETVQDWQMKAADKQKEKARDAKKALSPKEIRDAKNTIKEILKPFSWWNPLAYILRPKKVWYAFLDFAPGGNNTNKILTDNLETIREPNQSKGFQSDAMDIFRTHLDLIDTVSQRMGGKSFNFFPFTLFSKQNAEQERIKAEKTPYLNEVVASLDTHLSYIQDNMVSNTVQKTTGGRDSMGNYQARLLPRDISNLEKFAANISENGKYSRLMHLPAMDAIKQKVDKMVAELKNKPANNIVDGPSSNRAKGRNLAAAR